jgi:hypothetical protein
VSIRKLFKTVFLIGITSLLAAAVFLWFEGNKLVSQLTPRLELELERNFKAKFSISDLKIQLFPKFGISLGNLTVKPIGSCGEIFVDSGSLYLDLPAFISGKYIINSISLNSARASVSNANDKIYLANQLDASCLSLATEEAKDNREEKESIKVVMADPEDSIALHFNKLEINDLQITVVGAKTYKIIISKLDSAASLQNGKLVLSSPAISASIDSIPFALSAVAANWDLNTNTFCVEQGLANINKQTLKFSRNISAQTQQQEIKLEANAVELSQLTPIVKLLGLKVPEISSGKVDISMEFHFPNKDAIEAKGRLMLRDLSIIDGLDSYSAEKAFGPIQYRKEKTSEVVSGELTFSGFGFNDGHTEVKNVSAQLLNLKTTFGDRQDLKLFTNLNGTSVEVVTSDVEVKRFNKVNIPITVELKRKGGYSVSGLLTAAEGQVVLFGKDLQQLQGATKIFISTPLKEFSIQNLSANLLGKSLSMDGIFRMNSAAYLLKGIKTKINKGHADLEASIQRDSNKSFSSSIAIGDMQLADMLTIVQGTEDNAVEGRIRSLKTELHGSLNNPAQSLHGKGSVYVLGSKMKSFNLTRAIGSALSMIPFQNLRLSTDKLEKDTNTQRAEADFVIANQLISSAKVVLYSSNYTLIASGAIGFDLQLDFKAALIFAEKSLQSLGGGFDKLGKLFGRIGKVEIPLFIKGKFPNVSVSPDLVTLARNNSGITLAGEMISATQGAGRAVGDFVSSPFRSKKKGESQ